MNEESGVMIVAKVTEEQAQRLRDLAQATGVLFSVMAGAAIRAGLEAQGSRA